LIIDEGIYHDADEFGHHAPIVSQWTTFAAESQTFDKSHRSNVVRMDQSFDPMDMEFIGTVFEHRSAASVPKPFP
jgi:hypothetical protein